MSLFSFSSGQILALHSDGITLTGAVFRRKGGLPEEIARASAHSSDPAAALAEIIQSLAKAGTPPPKRVIIASDRAVFSRAELPVHPNQPRPYAQMRELARWESEMAFSDLPSWDIEAILLAMGVMSEQSDKRVRDEIALRTSQALGGPAPRYQDVALSMGAITRPMRDAAVELRESLNQPVGEAGCGWIPTSRKDIGDLVQHTWLLSAVTEFDREAWRDACTLNKLTLVGIVPSWGLSGLAASQKSTTENAENEPHLLLERHSGAISLINMTGETVESIRLVNLNRPDTTEGAVLHRILDGREQDRIVAVGFSDTTFAAISGTFKQVERLDDTRGAVLAGVAARGLALKGALLWPPLVTRAEPNPPIWKSDNFYRGALVAAVVLAIGGMDMSTRIKKAGFEEKLAELNTDYDRRRLITGKIQATLNAAHQFESEIDTARTEMEDLRRRERVAVYLQSRRQEIVVGLLEALRQSIPRGVVMRELTESRKTPEVFTLIAWALSDISAERFIANLNGRLEPLGLVVADETVFREAGPQGIMGYGAQFRIVPTGYGAMR